MHEQSSGGPNRAIQVRLQDNLLLAIENFRRGEPDVPTRPEAVRRLVQRALMAAQQQAEGLSVDI